MIKNLRQRIVASFKRRGLITFYDFSLIPESGIISASYTLTCLVHGTNFSRTGTQLERSGICPECNKELNLRKTRQQLKTPHLDLSAVPQYALSTDKVALTCIRCGYAFERRLDYLAVSCRCPKCKAEE